MKNFKEKADLIWRVADLLRGDYKQSDYGKVILPDDGDQEAGLCAGAYQTEGAGVFAEGGGYEGRARDLALNKGGRGTIFTTGDQFNFGRLIADPNHCH